MTRKSVGAPTDDFGVGDSFEVGVVYVVFFGFCLSFARYLESFLLLFEFFFLMGSLLCNFGTRGNLCEREVVSSCVIVSEEGLSCIAC